jgi:hypothetical protein
MTRRIVFVVAAVALVGIGAYVVVHQNAPAMKQVAVVGSVVAHTGGDSEEQKAPPAAATESDPAKDPSYVGSGKQQLDCMYNASTEAAYKHFGCEKIDGPWHAPVKDPLGNMTGVTTKPAAP